MKDGITTTTTTFTEPVLLTVPVTAHVKDKRKVAAYYMGIVAGRLGNKFDPKSNATRAEVAVMLYRALEQLKAC